MISNVHINKFESADQCLVMNNPTDASPVLVNCIWGARQVQHSVAVADHVASSIEESIINMTVDDGSDVVLDGATRAIKFAVAVWKLEEIFGSGRRTPPASLPRSGIPIIINPSEIQSDPNMPATTHPNDNGIVYGSPPPGDHEVWELPGGIGYYDDGSDSTWEDTLRKSWSFSVEYVDPTEYLGSFTTSSGCRSSRSLRVRIMDGLWDSISRTRSSSRSDPSSMSSSLDSVGSLEPERRRVEGLGGSWLRRIWRRGGRRLARREDWRSERDDSDGEREGCWGRRAERRRIIWMCFGK